MNFFFKFEIILYVGGALHNLPYHFQAGLTHIWFEKYAEEFGLELLYGYRFESLTNRLQRLLASGQCMEELYSVHGKQSIFDLFVETLPPIFDELRLCPQVREYAGDGSFPTQTRVVVRKKDPENIIYT